MEKAALYPIPEVTWLELAAGCLVYLSINTFLGRRRADAGEPKILKPLIVIHNAALCAYSGWTFYRSMLVMCAAPSKIYTHPYLLHYSELAYLAWVFYISKYYEFFDTWILLLQGKGGGFTYTLQVYHHIGAVITMGLGVKYRSTGYWVFVVYNSGVHTIMYLYYMLTAMRGILPKPLVVLTNIVKRYITLLQITQFITGIGATVPYFFLASFRQDTSALLALAVVEAYVVGLIFLFMKFFKIAYKDGKSGKDSNKKQR
eukprot:tig00000711_g3384.t1